VELDARVEKIGYKIREAQLQKVPYMLVIGDREVAEGAVSVRSRSKGDLGARPLAEFVEAAAGEAARRELAELRSRERRTISPTIVRPDVMTAFVPTSAFGFERFESSTTLDSSSGSCHRRRRWRSRVRRGLDLVEISPTAVPPVCRIMDFGKYQYQEQKRTRESKKHQRVILVKEIKFRPKVDEHDYQFKKKHIERFLNEGDKVKATIFFRGREMAHPEIGQRILERLLADLADLAIAETMPRREGNQMHVILGQRAGRKNAPKAPRAQEATRRRRRDARREGT
jgi:translation initiation factor IF-3